MKPSPPATQPSAHTRRDESDLETFRRTNVGQPLMEVAKDFQKRALALLNEFGHTGLQPSHQAVLNYLHLSGTRLTDLALRASMTKQAMGQIVDELERLGYVTRKPDPTDGRAKIVQFTERGNALIRDSRKIVATIQVEYASIIGEEKLAALRDSLEELRAATKSSATQP